MQIPGNERGGPEYPGRIRLELSHVPWRCALIHVIIIGAPHLYL